MNPTQQRRRLVPIASILIVLVNALACARGDAPEAGTPDPEDSVPTQSPIDSEYTEPASGPDTAWTVGTTRSDHPILGASVLRGVRTAQQADFDRIVFDFGTDSVPGYDIEYVDRPVTQCGSGETVPLAGDAWLRVRLEPANAHTEEGAPTAAPRERVLALGTLRELELICDFEAVVEWVAGVSSPMEYRAFVLRQPSRLVVDVSHRRR